MNLSIMLNTAACMSSICRTVVVDEQRLEESRAGRENALVGGERLVAHPEDNVRALPGQEKVHEVLLHVGRRHRDEGRSPCCRALRKDHDVASNGESVVPDEFL